MYNEKNKARFRLSTTRKLIVMCLALLLPVILVIVLHKINQEFEAEKSLIYSRYIIMSLFEVYILLKIVKYIRIIYIDNYCRLCFIKRYDERESFIRSRAYNIAYKIMVFAIGIVLIVSCYYSKEVFLVTLSFLVILLGSFYVALFYYKRKY